MQSVYPSNTHTHTHTWLCELGFNIPLDTKRDHFRDAQSDESLPCTKCVKVSSVQMHCSQLGVDLCVHIY